MNQIRSYIESGIWSLFVHSNYLGEAPHSIPNYAADLSNSGFYPSAWYIVTAYVCSFVNCSVPLAANATNLVISSVVFPLGMLLLHTVLFPNNRRVVLVGAVITMSFTAFPWGLFVKGPLFPNLLGLAVIPSFLSLFILFFEHNILQYRKFAFSLFFFIGLVVLSISQTNTVFVAFVFLSAYGGHYIRRQLHNSSFQKKTQYIVLTGYTVLIFAFWTACFNLPLLQNIVNYEWSPITSLPFSFAMAGSFAMPSFYPEPLLAIAALIGLIECIRKRKYWLIIPAFFMMTAFALDRSSTSLVRHFLSGFWYTDPFRSAANYAIFVTPIASLGFSCAIDWLYRHKDKLPVALRNIFSLGLASVIVFSAITFLPTIPLSSYFDNLPDIKTAYGTLQSRFKNAYRTDVEQVFSTEEQVFIDKVLETVPKDVLVINQPCDGSVFAYATDNLRTYYRYCNTAGQTQNAQLIRLSLNEIASNPKVQEAVNSIQADYVLQLDHNVAYENGTWLPQYKNPELWKGIDSIQDNTPGFTVILSEGDMRLYRIDDLQDLQSAA